MRPSILLPLLLLLAVACNSAQKAYNRGDYEQAVRMSVNTLRDDPRELSPPPPDVLFLEFTAPIHARLTERMRRFYAGY